MKDITAILVGYSDPTILHKALTSLKKLRSRLIDVIIFQEQKIPIHIDWLDQVQFLPVECNDLGLSLNHTICQLTSSYVLFLEDTDYLTIKSVDSLQLYHPKTVLGTFYHNRNIVIQRPLLVRTSLLKKEPFLSSLQLPFREALFPAWFSNIDPVLKFYQKDLVKQARENSSAHTIERLKMMEKYQLKNTKTNSPSLSILIANFNMEQYVETSVASCLMQNEQPEQLLVMDDGSTDSSYKRLQQWVNGGQVKVFNKKNHGKARALNDLLPHVTSDFILELDADDWLDPDAVNVIKKNLMTMEDEAAVIYGNLRKWKQQDEDVRFKGINKGIPIKNGSDLLSYRFPLGPRIYRTSSLKRGGGFPVVAFEDGRLYEDVSVLNRLIKHSQFCYRDFTVYNVREHKESITKTSDAKWNDFIKMLKRKTNG